MKKTQNNLPWFYLAAMLLMASLSVLAEEFNLENENYYKKAKADNSYISSEWQTAAETIQKAKIDKEDDGAFFVGGEDQDHELISKDKKETKAKQLPAGAAVTPVLDADVKEGLNPRLHSSIRGQDSVAIPENYSNVSNSMMIKKVAWKTDSSFGMTYFAGDNYQYHDSANVYNRVFRDGSRNTKSGLLMLSSSKFFARGFLDLKIGINIGAKYNSGYGLFPQGAQSETKFTLWTIPVDLAFGVDIPISRFLKFSVNGGPSALGLIQSRNDRDYGDKGADTREVGTGYFASAQALIGLSSIFPKYGVEMYTDYSVGQTQLSVEARTVHYKHFQDDITVDGTAFGVGIIFEFL